MTLATIQKEILTLGPEEQDKLAEQLTMLRLQRDEEYIESLDKTIDSSSDQEWISLEEVTKKLSE